MTTKPMSMERLLVALLEESQNLRRESLLTEDRIESSIIYYLSRSLDNLAHRLQEGDEGT